MNQEEPTTVHELLEQQYLDNLDREILGAERPAADDQAPTDAGEEAGPQQVDALDLVGDLIQDCLSSLLSKPLAAQRLEHKIALAQAMATMVQAQATRHLALLTQQQLQLVVHAQQQQAEMVANRAAGPAAIHIPTGPVVGLRG